jgi:adenylate cyclase class 2
MLACARVWQHSSFLLPAHQSLWLIYTGLVAERHFTKREIEIKLYISNLRDILQGIHKLGAVSRGRVFEQNTLYDTPEGDIRSTGRLLRLRVETPAPTQWSRGGHRANVLTFKSPLAASSGRNTKPPYKEYLEREFKLRASRQWPKTLRSLGLRPSFRYDKYRTSFRLAHLHLDLDETPMGVFLELEGTPAAIDRVARMLGFTRRDYIRESYGELYALYCRRRGVAPRNMVFRR